jgi:hypothetical protein
MEGNFFRWAGALLHLPILRDLNHPAHYEQGSHLSQETSRCEAIKYYGVGAFLEVEDDPVWEVWGCADEHNFWVFNHRYLGGRFLRAVPGDVKRERVISQGKNSL